MSNDQIIATLDGGVLAVVQAVLAECPWAILTSGGRDLAAQAHAMAVDAVGQEQAKGDPCWVAQTYRDSPVEEDVEAAVEAALTNESTADDIAAVILGVLQTFSDSDLLKLSVHLILPSNGKSRAVDFQPDDRLRDPIQQAVAAAGSTAKFLDHEGSLKRFHVQVL